MKNLLKNIAETLDSCDYLRLDNKIYPPFVVLPESSSQVADILQAANREGFPVYVVGKGSEIRWERLTNDGILLSTERLKKNIVVHKNDFVVEVDCGFSCEEISQKCTENALLFPLQNLNGKISTIGGNYCSGTESIFDFYYGSFYDNVLGVEFISPEGKFVRFGGKSLKNVTGYNFQGFLYGSNGKFGVITKLFIKLYPLKKILDYCFKISYRYFFIHH